MEPTRGTESYPFQWKLYGGVVLVVMGVLGLMLGIEGDSLPRAGLLVSGIVCGVIFIGWAYVDAG